MQADHAQANEDALLVDVQAHPLSLTRCTDFVTHPSAGAVSTFSGITRNSFQGKAVLYLEYEAYLPMALKQLRSVGEAMLGKWELVKVALVHRVGRVDVSEPSVIIAASSAHRRDALEAVHWAIDEVKAVVPVWKKEFFADGSQWKENAESRVRLLDANGTSSS